MKSVTKWIWLWKMAVCFVNKRVKCLAHVGRDPFSKLNTAEGVRSSPKEHNNDSVSLLF